MELPGLVVLEDSCKAFHRCCCLVRSCLADDWEAKLGDCCLESEQSIQSCPKSYFRNIDVAKSGITSFIKLIKFRSANATSSSSSLMTFGSGVNSIPAHLAISIKYLRL